MLVSCHYIFSDFLPFQVCYDDTDWWCQSIIQSLAKCDQVSLLRNLFTVRLNLMCSDFYQEYSNGYLDLIPEILSQWFSFHLDTQFKYFLAKIIYRDNVLILKENHFLKLISYRQTDKKLKMRQKIQIKSREKKCGNAV